MEFKRKWWRRVRETERESGRDRGRDSDRHCERERKGEIELERVR